MISSILYRNGENYTAFDMDTVVADLHMDRIVDRILDVGKECAPRDFFFRKPAGPGDVPFRLSVIRELEDERVYGAVQRFLSRYNLFRLYLDYSIKLPQPKTKQKWLLDAACVYCDCLNRLYADLSEAPLASEGLRQFRDCLGLYRDAQSFRSLLHDSSDCRGRLDSVRFCIDIDLRENTVELSGDCGGGDYFETLARIFSAFGCEALGREIIALPGVNMGPLELRMLGCLESLYPDAFASLEGFYRKHAAFGHELADLFEREAQFYMAYIDYMRLLQQSGIRFCYPEFTDTLQLEITGGHDLALIDPAGGESGARAFDFDSGPGQICHVVTGPDQSARTSFIRMAGQAAYLSLLGLPVPCAGFKSCFLHGIHTHFARGEDLSTNFGRLKEELVRAKQILDRDGGGSLVLFHDILASTTSYDAGRIGKRLLSGLAERDSICIFATQIGELADTDVAHVHRLEGGAAGDNILEKYGLSASLIRERIR